MPAKKGDTPVRIQDAARTVFLRNGFRNSSIQQIAAAVGISAPGVYKHFESKEAIFSSLVEPLIAQISGILHSAETRKDVLFQKGERERVWNKEETFRQMLDFVYANFTDMKLLLCCADGTAYENIIDRVADYETGVVLRTLPALREKDASLPEVDAETVSLMMRHQYRTYAECIKNDYDRAHAERYLQDLNTFFTAGWRALLKF